MAFPALNWASQPAAGCVGLNCAAPALQGEVVGVLGVARMWECVCV